MAIGTEFREKTLWQQAQGAAEYLVNGSGLADAFNRCAFPALSNGISTRVYAQPGETKLYMTIAIARGSHSDPADKPGIAHMVEHMAFQQEDRGVSSTILEVERRGGYINASTSYRETKYEFMLPDQNDNFEFMSRLAGDMLIRRDVSERQLSYEKEVVKDEARNLQDSLVANPGRYASMLARGMDPADDSVVGSAESIDAMTADDLRAFRKTHYIPANITISLCSGRNPAMMVMGLEKFFGGIAVAAAEPVPDAEQRRSVAPYAPGGESRIEDKSMSQSSYALALPLPTGQTTSAATMLGAYLSRRIFEIMRGPEQRYSYSQHIHVDRMVEDRPCLTLFGQAKPEYVGLAVRRYLDILREVAEGKIDGSVYRAVTGGMRAEERGAPGFLSRLLRRLAGEAVPPQPSADIPTPEDLVRVAREQLNLSAPGMVVRGQIEGVPTLDDIKPSLAAISAAPAPPVAGVAVRAPRA